MTKVLLAVAVILAATSAAAQQARPRDFLTGRPSTGTGVITGRVTTSDTGVPLRQAIVAASSAMGMPRETTTDDQGRFELRGMEPGPWQVMVSRSGYITRKFGQSRPFGRATAITMANGQRVNIEIPLTRGSAIVGRVVDEFGEPVTAARVVCAASDHGSSSAISRADWRRRLHRRHGSVPAA
jgi:protocatechuate 3,4-dioxygenase beta subunit